MDQGHVRRLAVLEPTSACIRIVGEGALHPLLAEIAGDRGLQVSDTDTRLPAPGRELGTAMPADEDAGLDAFDGARIARQRAEHEGGRVDDQAEQRHRHQGIGFGAGEERCTRQQEIEDGCRHMGIVRAAEARHEEQVGPDEEAQGHSEDGAPGVRTPPDEASEKARGHLGNGSEGEEADGCQPRFAVGAAIIGIAEHQDGDDRGPPDPQQGLGEIGPMHRTPHELAAEEHRHDNVVRHHDGQRDRSDDDHRRRGREATDEGDQRDDRHFVGERQEQYVEVGIARAAELDEACHCDRQHEEVDRHEVERQEVARCLQFQLGAVLDDRDVELPRQHDDGEGRQHDQQNPAADGRLIGHGRGDEQVLRGALPQIRRPVEEEEYNGNTDRGEGQQLDDGLHRHCKDQAVLVFRGIRVAGPEHHGETRHQDRDDQREVDEIEVAAANPVGRGVHHGGNGAGNGFQLQGDIGDRSDQRDESDDHGDRRVLAVAGSDEVGD